MLSFAMRTKQPALANQDDDLISTLLRPEQPRCQELHKPTPGHCGALELRISVAPSCSHRRGKHCPQRSQLRRGWLTYVQGRDATFDLLQLGFYVSLTFLLSFHQEIDLLFFCENIIGVNLPRQNQSDDHRFRVAWLGPAVSDSSSAHVSSSCSQFRD